MGSSRTVAKYKLLIGPLTSGNLQDAFMRDLAVLDVWPGSLEPNPIAILERFCTGISSELVPGEDEVAVEVMWTWGRSKRWELRNQLGVLKAALLI